MYDYAFLEIKEYPEGSVGYGKLYVGLCTTCQRSWSTTAADLSLGTTTLRKKYRHHTKRGSASEPCTAGLTYYSPEYERYKLGIKTPLNEPAGRYNR